MTEFAEIVRQAFKTDSAGYTCLIEETAELLASEEGQIGSLHISGRLVEAQPIGEAIVVGDLHGDLNSLRYLVENSAFIEKATQNKEILLIFLGDYGDRGVSSPEVYFSALTLKQQFPQKVVLLRGNHEGPDDLLAHPHDLPDNLRMKFGGEGSTIYLKIRELFSYLNLGVVVEGRCVIIHGGVPSSASSLDDLKLAHISHPITRHFEEILWSDPSETTKGTLPSSRGAGRLFGEDVTAKFLNMLNVKLLIRGHEPVPNGFKISHNGKILTLFSRKGAPYFNSFAAYLHFNLSMELRNAYSLSPYTHQF